MKRRTLIFGIASLASAFLAHSLWTTRLNFLVWNLTYVGVHVAHAIHQPDYDSAASVRMFDVLTTLANALIYFAVLVAMDRVVVAFRRSRLS